MSHPKRTYHLEFDVTSYNTSPKRRHLYCFITNSNTPSFVSPETTKDKCKRSLIFGFEIPKNCEDIIHIDEAAGNTM